MTDHPSRSVLPPLAAPQPVLAKVEPVTDAHGQTWVILKLDCAAGTAAWFFVPDAAVSLGDALVSAGRRQALEVPSRLVGPT